MENQIENTSLSYALEAIDLLTEINVYPLRVDSQTLAPLRQNPEAYVDLVNSKPRVQISTSAEVAKKILKWQCDLQNQGLNSASFSESQSNQPELE